MDWTDDEEWHMTCADGYLRCAAIIITLGNEPYRMKSCQRFKVSH